MSSPGVVTALPFDLAKVIDHAMRRAGYVPQRVAGEAMSVARDLAYSLLSEYVNVGMPLWTQEFQLLGIQIGSPDVATPDGTVDVLHSYWRILNPWRGPATLPDGTSGTVLFAGQPNSDVTIAGPNAYIDVNFTTQIEVDTVGILLGGSSSITTALEILGSNDGVTFTHAQYLPSATYAPMQWTYFDLDPSLTTYQYLRTRYNSANPWVLNQLNYGLANGQDIENGPLSIDDYYNLPNKQFQSDRPVSTYTVRNVDSPQLKLWPTPSTTAFYNGTVSALMRRYIQTPGAFADNLEIPRRWLEAVIWRLASRLCDEIPPIIAQDNSANPYGAISSMQERQARIQRCEQMAARSEQIVWGEERNRGPIKMYPSLRPYTA